MKKKEDYLNKLSLNELLFCHLINIYFIKMSKGKIILSIHAQSIYNNFGDDLDHYFAQS